MDRPATLRDVADRADVHPSTASRALNERTRDLLNPVTARRVLVAADELGYQANPIARGLKTSRTMTIGMVVPDLTNPLFPPIVRGLEDRLGPAGFTLLIANTDLDPQRETAVVEALRARRIDGLVAATSRSDNGLLAELAAAGLPLVLVNRAGDPSGASSVTPDDHAGIGQAVTHLVELGHTRIAHLAGSPRTSTGGDRLAAFRHWTAHHGLAVDDDLVATAEAFTEADGAAACQALMERGTAFTAIVAANDLVALGCYEVLREHGLRVPEDVSVVGYNDISFTHAFCPPLTSVRVPLYDLGRRAADLLLEAIDDDAAPTASVRLTPSLVVRRSTSPHRQDG